MINKNIKNICCGDEHTCYLLETGEVYVFGANGYGQLGLGDNKNRNTPTLLMTNHNIKTISTEDHTLILTMTGELYVFGDNNFGQLGLGDTNLRNFPTLLQTDKNIKSIHCGESHTLVYKTSGELYGFGDNTYAQLGLSVKCVKTPTLLMTNKAIRQIICRKNQNIIYKYNGELYLFGLNSLKDLGLKKYQYEPKLFTICDDVKIIGGKIIRPINWNSELYSYLTLTKRQEILMLLSICYQIKNTVKVSKDMKNYIISFLF
jgi:alpha-tubulin suppressor-like RCC1 family protein